MDESAILPLSKWPRKLSNWDVPPEGHETSSAQHVKTFGAFAICLSRVYLRHFQPDGQWTSYNQLEY
jgi:hypothetical protein